MKLELSCLRELNPEGWRGQNFNNFSDLFCIPPPRPLPRRLFVILESEVGGKSAAAQPGNRFRFRFVRACARSGCRVEFGLKSGCGPFPFSLFPQRVFPFPLRVPPSPQPPIQLQLALSVHICTSEVGGMRPTGKSFRFVSFVRACVRAVWL